MSELNLVLLGPPGSGKGTQGERLQEDFQLPYYATGDILRAAVRDKTELGKTAKQYMDRGDFVPDDVIIGVIVERLGDPEAADGFILDGFPRTMPQARPSTPSCRSSAGLSEPCFSSTSPTRRSCGGSAGGAPASRTAVTSTTSSSTPRSSPRPATSTVAGCWSATTTSRGDPAPLEQYHEKTEPLIDYYDEKGLLRRIDGTPSPDEVGDRIRALLATLKMEEDTDL